MRAVVKEGLRLSYGVPGRMMREVPVGGAKFGETWVPGGVSSVDVISIERSGLANDG